MKDNILASGVAGVPHIAIWDQILSDRYGNLDLTPLLIYLVDIAPSAALQSLGDQFAVLGLEGWFLATDDASKRELIKNAIQNKRYKGTPWAVKNAFKSVGYGNSTIVEGVDATYDGTFSYDGEITYGSNWWALFSVENLDLGETKGLNANDIQLLRNLVDIYKRAAAHLVDISFAANVADEQTMTGTISFQVQDTLGNVIEDYAAQNLIVDVGRTNLANLLSGVTANRSVDHIGFGIGTTPEDPSDTALTSQFTKTFTGISYPDAKSVQFAWLLDYSENNGVDITEFGLLSNNGNLFSRKVRNPISKTSDIRLVGFWVVSFE